MIEFVGEPSFHRCNNEQERKIAKAIWEIEKNQSDIIQEQANKIDTLADALEKTNKGLLYWLDVFTNLKEIVGNAKKKPANTDYEKGWNGAINNIIKILEEVEDERYSA